MATENDPEARPDFSPIEEVNPFAPPEISETQYASPSPKEPLDPTRQIPPIKPSYGIAIGVFLLACFLFLALGPQTFAMGAPTAPLGVLGFVATPFAIARLSVHRKNIKRAIENRRFPGGVQFDGLYFLSSLAIACFAVFAGILVFFGICLLVLYDGTSGLGEQGGIVVIVIDAVLAFLTTSFLIRLATPRYE